jgi:hypothetical protein
MRTPRLVVCLSILAATLLAASAREKEETFQGVQQAVQERTRKTVRWEMDQAAREQALQDVRRLLRKPLTAESAVQIALFNNRSLQATIEEIGLSQADLIEAATIPNPKIDLSIRFPDKPPSGTYIDYSAAKAEEARTEREYIEAFRDYWIARTDLERAVGGNLRPRVLGDGKNVTRPISKPSSAKVLKGN